MSINSLSENHSSTLGKPTLATQDSKKASSTSEPLSSEQKATAPVSETTANISTRAQKLQKLAEEFFPGGPGELKITANFVARLKEYELISQSQFDSMPSNLTSGDKVEDSDTTSKISKKIDEVLEKLRDASESSHLFTALAEGKDQLSSIENSKNDTGHGSYKISAQKIAVQLESNSSDVLNSSDKKAIQEMIVTLSLADTFASSKNGSEKLNNYLSSYH